MTSFMRVRQVLDSLDSTSRNALKKLLPTGLKMPDKETQRYPSALLASFPKDDSYSLLGILAENMLNKPKESIVLEELLSTVSQLVPGITDISINKIRKSVTTTPFLEALIATRTELDAHLKEIKPTTDKVLQYKSLEGHPDMCTPDTMIEIKLTGLLKTNWTYFLFQLFSYGALEPQATNLLLVLPLQRCVLHFDIRGWKKRNEFRDFMVSKADSGLAFQNGGALLAMLLREQHRIGSHIHKLKSLVDTVSMIPDTKPYQLFLGGPQSSRLTIEDGELAATASEISKRNSRIYVHSQYIINISNRSGDFWAEELLIKNLQYAVAMGCRGVVVHVGKSTGMEKSDAVKNMRDTLTNALKHATPDCPLLLETPAGQGTELLTDSDEFIDFVDSFQDKRLRVCIDTCHVFACGHKPLDYIKKIQERKDLLKLVHYNDSATPCGSCLDRHAFMGTGHIGMDGMKEIAELCTSISIPMVIE
jgi:deoxyribonuclease-4